MEGASAQAVLAGGGAGFARRARPQRAWRWLRRSPAAITGGALVLLLIVVALAAPLVAPFDPTAIHIGSLPAGPSGSHLLGTDQLGRDIFSRVIFGTRVSLM